MTEPLFIKREVIGYHCFLFSKTIVKDQESANLRQIYLDTPHLYRMCHAKRGAKYYGIV